MMEVPNLICVMAVEACGVTAAEGRKAAGSLIFRVIDQGTLMYLCICNDICHCGLSFT